MVKRRAGGGAALVAAAGIALAGGLASAPASAGANLEADRQIGKILIIGNERRYLRARGQKPPASNKPIPPGQPAAPAAVGAKSDTALLPQVGYNPADGFILGGKYSVIGYGPSRLNLDVGATQSTAGNSSFSLSLGAPRLFGSERVIGLLQLGYDLAPTRSFYGLGNNGIGDNILSTHEYRERKALVTLGYRLAPHWLATVGAGLDDVTISRGNSVGSNPRTVERYPNLPDAHGGANNPVSLALLYNTRRDVTRPARGWQNVVKVQHVGPELGNSVNYTRYLADFKYVQPIFSRDNILGVRVSGTYLDGSGDDLPFYELATLGGSSDFEGFQQDRFRGQSRLFAQIGYRRLLADFNFYDIWRVRLDGALFAGAGRVFLDESRLPDDVALDELAPGSDDEIQFSYGTGLRIALSEALIARVDAGFSKESKGLFYLQFGNRF